MKKKITLEQLKRFIKESRRVDPMPSRAFTNALIEDAEMGILDWESIARSALGYMSEDEVRDMAESEFDYEAEEDDEDSEDDEELEESFGYMPSRPRRSPRRTASYSVDADDLFLFITNDSDMYEQSIVPCIKNLEKKFNKGNYDKELAIKLWKHVADRGAQKYDEEIGDEEGNTARRFEGNVAIASVETRMEVARKLEEYYFENVNGEDPLVVENFNEGPWAERDEMAYEYSSYVPDVAESPLEAGFYFKDEDDAYDFGNKGESGDETSHVRRETVNGEKYWVVRFY